MELINDKANHYAGIFSSPPGELLSEIAEFTNANHSNAHMLSSHLQGRFLEMISCMIGPERILEIGTFTGYSALCLAKGLSTNGVLHTIEMRDKDSDIAEAYFKRSLYYQRIILHRGNALEIINKLNEPWDIVFIDADKTAYIDYYELTLPSLKPGGIMIADNVLFHGKVLGENISGKNALSMHAFNEHVKRDKRVEQVIVTLRDGISIIRKLKI